MSSAFLKSSLVEVKPNDRNDLLGALEELGSCDLDFIGENGLEYLWNEVWKVNGFEDIKDYEEQNECDSDDDENYKEIKLKYESNLEYLLDKVKDIISDIDCVEEFVNIWMENDRNYYQDYSLNYITDKYDNITAISLAMIAGY